MKAGNRHYVKTLLRVRRSAIEILAIAVAVAFGINFMSGGLMVLLGMSAELSTGIGAALTFLGITYLGIRLKPLSARELTLAGVLPMTRDRKIYEIERYELSEKLRSYFVGLTEENKAIAKLWRESEIGLQLSEENGTARIPGGQGHSLVREALEYFVLDKLSLHLNEYFESEREVAEDAIVRIQRSDIPHILLENRFLELFCKPMEMREAFLERDAPPFDHKVVYAVGKGGVIFEHFELILPRYSKLTRSNKSALKISTNRFSLTITPIFEGFSTVFPHMFNKLYLGKNIDEVHPYIVNVHVNIEFKWWALLTGTGWDYYEWLDSFLDNLSDAFSFDDFIKSIGWDTAVSSGLVVKHLLRTEAQNDD